jgi:hypothetical protein
MKSLKEGSIEEHGFRIVPDVFTRSEVENLLGLLGSISGAGVRVLIIVAGWQRSRNRNGCWGWFGHTSEADSCPCVRFTSTNQRRRTGS